MICAEPGFLPVMRPSWSTVATLVLLLFHLIVPLAFCNVRRAVFPTWIVRLVLLNVIFPDADIVTGAVKMKLVRSNAHRSRDVDRVLYVDVFLCRLHVLFYRLIIVNLGKCINSYSKTCYFCKDYGTKSKKILMGGVIE